MELSRVTLYIEAARVETTSISRRPFALSARTVSVRTDPEVAPGPLAVDPGADAAHCGGPVHPAGALADRGGFQHGGSTTVEERPCGCVALYRYCLRLSDTRGYDAMRGIVRPVYPAWPLCLICLGTGVDGRVAA